ncbi:acetyl-CoA carboxylase biotin carboxyl carrier protein subunit [Leptobacterium flavescens]|uniref:Acetyl-CoA carboxylase biotin carboxyl carrier protein subunit n=1 Tax=Leptobacterium flavescens TaxID=472055 RepID=A0A6P0UPE4_9FLAO|nr:biotin/lipoyl-containing protein [Leptobacterium flavescens]NER13699.1 acetyl-CoA carboxylase biotin carboxyl carrier protein subunit [Leptobacterium flavescens]
MKKFKVNVNNSFDFDLTEEDVKGVDSIQKGDSGYHIINNDRSLDVVITESDFHNKNYTIKIGTNSYSVSISDELAQLITEMGLSLGSSKQVNTVKAPMPGLIIDVKVAEGDSISENDSLVVMEAMKMENILMAPRDGVVKSVTVNTGETVDKGALLIELE